MKIGIVTSFYSENTGTVLQAYALARVLELRGHTVVFLNTINKYSTHGKKALILNVGKDILKFRWSSIIYTILRYKEFGNFFKKFNICELEDSASIDCFIIGSDTVWDINSNYFLAFQDLFWGERFEGNKIITYAASVANSTIEQMKKLNYPEILLKRMKCISVRDAHSYAVISELVNKDIEQVCDPTFLLNYDDYHDLVIPGDYDRFLLIYIFEEIEPEIIKHIVDFAEINKLKIISYGRKRKWCSEAVVASVHNFISMYAKADFVVTNTFHGTVFSIINKKQFLSLTKKKKKVVELLRQLDLESRLATQIDEVKMCFADQIDYGPIDEKLLEIRKRSFEYLTTSLSHFK